jgi:uncharacterized protein (DUF2249 family)
MNNEITIDVRPMPPRERHPTIFNTWESLPDGSGILLLNDHDPLPLYYQFAMEYAGGFRWDYLDRGPQLWRVRISKGAFADPGFVPAARAAAKPAQAPVAALEPLVLDVRPIFARGGSPCTTIDDAVASLRPGQTFVLVAPFEPAPLFGKLGAKGFRHKSLPQIDGSWRIEFEPTGAPQPAGASGASCGCPGHA